MGMKVRLSRASESALGLALVGAIVLVAALVLRGAGSPPAPIPTSVDGLPVMTVSEALAEQARGGLGTRQIALRGFWSDGSIAHSCNPPDEPVGDLELRCRDGEAGITELDEPITVIDRNRYVTEPKGPHLSPWFPQGLAGADALFNLPFVNNQRYPPVPIVVVGHFNDPRSSECGPSARQICVDRLVVDRIVLFDVGSVPTPGVTPTPTPFPSPAPAGLFDKGSCSGDVPYSFVGWTTTEELQLQFNREGHVWAMVTKDPVDLGDGQWNDDPNGSGHQFKPFGRRICIAQEGSEAGTLEFGYVPGTAYLLWDDGLRTEGVEPVRPPSGS